MAKILPTIAFTSNANTASTNSGPNSIAVAASITDSLTVDLMEQQLVTVTVTRARIFDGSAIHGATTSMDPGTDGGYLFMKNNDTTTGNNIHVGIVAPAHASNDPATPATDGATSSLDGTTQETLRTLTLKPGEFAWFPWDYTGDIWVESAQNSPILEVWRWDRA